MPPAMQCKDGSSVSTFEARGIENILKKRRCDQYRREYGRNGPGRKPGSEEVKGDPQVPNKYNYGPHMKREHGENGPGRKFDSGRVKVAPKVLNKYNYGPNMEGELELRPGGARFKRFKVLQKEKRVEAGREQTARAELLLTEQSGCMEAAEGFDTSALEQRDILESADITTKSKSFNLTLHEFGPYRFQYLHDGRQLVIAGESGGHLASFNWLTKKLAMEVNVAESLHDVCFLGQDKAIAVAQKKWVHIYDNAGTQIHCVKGFYNILKLDFLPYHFLLTGLGAAHRLQYLDVTLGKEILSISTGKDKCNKMAANPYNGVVCTGGPAGVVAMWTPNSSTAVASVLCHKAPITDIAFDPAGRYMVTASLNRDVKIWDARNLGEQLHSYKQQYSIQNIALSQTGLLAVSYDQHVKVLRGIQEADLSCYMTHHTDTKVHQMQFCPYEDVLGISTQKAFSSIVIPGAGEANIDAMEANPFSSVKGGQEALIKRMLEKLPPELITLDPATITQVDVPTLEEKLEARRKLVHLKMPRIDVHPRYRMKGKSGSVQMTKRKDIKKDTIKARFLAKKKIERREAGIEDDQPRQKDKHKEKLHENVLDRFNK